MAGRYLNKNSQNKKKKRAWLVVLIVVVVLVGLGIVGKIALDNWMYSKAELVNKVPPTNPTTAPTTQATDPTPEGTPQETTEDTEPTEETWPVVVPTEKVTTIMLVGQNYRWDETSRLSDTMIMCTINWETKTLYMTSILRDLYVPLPAYAGHGAGRNRINVCYHLGTEWTGSVLGGMEMLALCVEQNFGIPIDHTVEVGFESFEYIIDTLGGVEIDLTEAEAKYLTEEIGYVGDFEPGLQTLTGIEALAYCRIRAIDSDFARTDRQRNLILSLIKKCSKMNIWELNDLVNGVLPMVSTDMTSDEIVYYVKAFLPLLLDLNIVSQKIPLEKSELGAWSYKGYAVDGIGNILEPNLWSHKQYLQNQLGYADAE